MPQKQTYETEAPLTKGARTRLRILDAAIECFVESGLDGASLSNIAERAETHKPVIIHYFGDRNQLLQEAFERMASQAQAWTADRLQNYSKIGLEEYIHVQFDWMLAHKTHAKLWLSSITSPAYQDQTQDILEPIFQRSREKIKGLLLQKFQGRNSPAASDLEDAVVSIHTMLVGSMLLCDKDSPKSMSQFRKSAVTTTLKLAQGLRTPRRT